MTLTAKNPAVFFDAAVHDLDDFSVFSKAQAGNQGAQAVVMAKPFDRGANFVLDVNCTADTDDGVVLSFGGGSTTVGAGFDQGVTFPAGSRRDIHFRVTSRGGGSTAASTGALYVGEYVQTVYGVASATTAGVSHPEVSGEPRLVRGHQRTVNGTTAVYGEVHYRATIDSGGATVTATDNPGGMTLAAFSSGAADLTFLGTDAPFRVRYKGGALSGTAVDARGMILLVDSAGGTDAVQTSSADDPQALAQPIPGDIDLAFEIWPPTFVRLLASSTTTGTANTPGLVTLELDSNIDASATTYAAQHRVEVWVGKATYDRP